MNVNRSVLIVGACLCVAALSLATYGAGGSAAHSKVNCQWMADGGAPTPPWPKLPSKLTLVADGGAPTPPWPKLPATSQAA
jgi:hypothetical protein